MARQAIEQAGCHMAPFLVAYICRRRAPLTNPLHERLLGSNVAKRRVGYPKEKKSARRDKLLVLFVAREFQPMTNVVSRTAAPLCRPTVRPAVFRAHDTPGLFRGPGLRLGILTASSIHNL